MERLRALAVERNFALVTVDQLTRVGHERAEAHSVHIGESWGQVHTADITITHSATDAERQRGLARLYVDHARGEEDKFAVLITQSLATGQFCLNAVKMPKDYFERLLPKERAQPAELPPPEDSEQYDNDNEAA